MEPTFDMDVFLNSTQLNSFLPPIKVTERSPRPKSLSSAPKINQPRRSLQDPNAPPKTSCKIKTKAEMEETLRP